MSACWAQRSPHAEQAAAHACNIFSGELGIGVGLAGDHAFGGLADVGTVEIGPYAGDEVGDVVFGQARIGAGGAGLCAFGARFDTGHQRGPIDGVHVEGVGVEHGCCCVHGVLPSCGSPVVLLKGHLVCGVRSAQHGESGVEADCGEPETDPQPLW